MRFILLHASHHVYIFVTAVTVFMQTVSTAAAAAAAPPPPTGQQADGGNSNTNLVTVTIDDREPIEMNINTNGDLAYEDLDLAAANLGQRGIVYDVAAVSDVNAKCFFWKRDTVGSPNLDFATTVFSSREENEIDMDEESGILFEDPDRVYCYDGSRDSIDGGGTFTLLMERYGESRREPAAEPTEANRSDQPSSVLELLRVKVERVEDFAEISLVDARSSTTTTTNREFAQPSEYESALIKLIDWPALGGSNYFESIDAESRADADLRQFDPGCYFLEIGETSIDNTLLVGKSRSRTISPIDAIDRVVCFRDQDNPRMRQNWQQARSRDQKA